MVAAEVEVFRTHTPSGEPDPATEVFEIWPKNKWRTTPDAVEEWIRPYRPSRTSQPCVYRFDSPERGRGRIVVNIQGTLYREQNNLFQYPGKTVKDTGNAIGDFLKFWERRLWIVI